MKKITLTLIMSALTFTSIANNIQLSNASLTGQNIANHTVQVKFDLSWDNAWRTSTTAPLNWDAAWVFVKYRVSSGEWHHARISTSGYVQPPICTIDVAPDSAGAFIYTSATGNGGLSFPGVELQWDYGANGLSDDAQVEIKVFAIEMVYISAGPFYIGDGLDDSGRGQFHYADSVAPYYVSSETSIPCGNNPGNLYADFQLSLSGSIPGAFPKGFNAFYCMKYEISQEQYMEFLNTLTRQQQDFNTNTVISGTSVSNYFVMANTSTPSWGSAIRCETTLPASGPVTFYMDLDNDGNMNEANDGQNHPVNYLKWTSLAAYLDWAGLRPMSELEYEKACRGPQYPVPGEYVWGTTAIHSAGYTASNVGYPNETIINPGTFIGNAFYEATRGGNLITRCGIFAASAVNPSRQETGAGYYGCMELSGSVYEQTVSTAFLAGRSYTGLHGDGELNPAGHATTDFWPGINGNSNVFTANQAYNSGSGIGVTNTAGIGLAGGYIGSTNSQDLRLSDRFNRGWTAGNFSSPYGGRGCRTAP